MAAGIGRPTSGCSTSERVGGARGPWGAVGFDGEATQQLRPVGAQAQAQAQLQDPFASPPKEKVASMTWFHISETQNRMETSDFMKVQLEDR